MGASFGSAILAAGNPGDWVRIERTLEPQTSTADVYDELYGRYLELYPRTAEDMHALARLGASGG